MLENKFAPTYLYIKTHRVTGLKYFGKTIRKKPAVYKGSGTDWRDHLQMYGNNVNTEIYGFYTDINECKNAALEFSIKHNIVESPLWANKTLENGLGGNIKRADYTVSYTVKHIIRNQIGMNTKIYNLLKSELEQITTNEITPSTFIPDLDITPAKFEKFKDKFELELGFSFEVVGDLETIVKFYDEKYSNRFFGEIWQPRTNDYNFTGWQLVEEINKQNPKAVLDVGCGYHPFKNRIPNLTGIDPYNHAAEYQVDILEYKVKPESYDHIIALGSINFNSKEDIEARFSHCVNLLQKGGKFYLRANPGITHKTGPYVDIFPWSFEVVNEFAEKYSLNLETFQKDANDRLYFAYTKK